MKNFNFLALPLSIVIFSFTLNGFSQPAPANDQQQVPQQAFQRYLSYLEPSLSRHYNIETTWIIKGEREKEEAIYARISDQLRSQLAAESRLGVFPSLLTSEAIAFQRRVVCDEQRTDLIYSRREKIRTSSSAVGSYGDSYRVAYGETTDERAAIGGSRESYLHSSSYYGNGSQRESYNSHEASSVDLREVAYEKTCTKKHLEFRGVLVAERVLSYVTISEEVKLFLIRKGVQNLSADFTKRHKSYSEVLHAILNTKSISHQDVERLGYTSPAALVVALQSELTSLISTYRFVIYSADFFRKYTIYPELSDTFAQMGSEMKMRLLTTKSLFESFTPKALSIGFRNGDKVESQFFYSETELIDLFKFVDADRPFSFNSHFKNHASAVADELEEEIRNTTPCQRTFYNYLKTFKEGLQTNSLTEFNDRNAYSTLEKCSRRVEIRDSSKDGSYMTYERRKMRMDLVKSFVNDKNCIYVKEWHPNLLFFCL